MWSIITRMHNLQPLTCNLWPAELRGRNFTSSQNKQRWTLKSKLKQPRRAKVLAAGETFVDFKEQNTGPCLLNLESSLILATAGEDWPVKLLMACPRWRPPLLYQARRGLPGQRSELRKALTQLWGNDDRLPHWPEAALTHTVTPATSNNIMEF